MSLDMKWKRTRKRQTRQEGSHRRSHRGALFQVIQTVHSPVSVRWLPPRRLVRCWKNPHPSPLPSSLTITPVKCHLWWLKQPCSKPLGVIATQHAVH